MQLWTYFKSEGAVEHRLNGQNGACEDNAVAERQFLARYSFTGRGCQVVASSIVQLHEGGPANP